MHPVGTASEITLPTPDLGVASGHRCVYSKQPSVGKYTGQDGKQCIGEVFFFFPLPLLLVV